VKKTANATTKVDRGGREVVIKTIEIGDKKFFSLLPGPRGKIIVNQKQNKKVTALF
jgi:hypothetical protein